MWKRPIAFSVRESIKRGIIHIVENPRGSLFWRTAAWLRIRDLFTYTAFQACAYGGRRPKHTALAFTHPAFAKFCRSCPNCPDHLPWGLSSTGWATAEEAVYPMPFCEQVAATFVHIFEQPSQGIDYHQMRRPQACSRRPARFRRSCPNTSRLWLSGARCRFSSRLACAWKGSMTLSHFQPIVSVSCAACRLVRNFCMCILRIRRGSLFVSLCGVSRTPRMSLLMQRCMPFTQAWQLRNCQPPLRMPLQSVHTAGQRC